MMSQEVRVYFHMPSPDLIRQVPTTIAEYTTWVHHAIESMPARRPTGEIARIGSPYNWIVQTYIYLRQRGFRCELVADLPREGIIIGHTKLLPSTLRPGPRQFVVEVKPDKFLQCTFANFAIVQSRRDSLHAGFRRWIVPSTFVQNWPQPGLIARDHARGDRFENVCFMGSVDVEFIKEIDELGVEIKKLGLQWMPMPRERWHDYSETDAIVAVRPAGSLILDRKPPTRLINSWIAGTPAILSPDPAFEDIRRSPLDYLAARNVGEIIDQLKRLMSDVGLRGAMVANGRLRAPEFSAEKNVERWAAAIEQQIVPRYRRWTRSPMRRRLFFLVREIVQRTVGIDPDPRRFDRTKQAAP